MSKIRKKKSAFCKIFTEKGCGTGFICEVKIKDKKIKFLFTNYHVINKDQINNIGSNILIFNNDEEKIIEIKDNRFVYTSVNLDFTCIEIFENENFKNYLEIDKSINCENPLEEFKNDLLVIMQCPENEDVSYAEGKIKDFRKKIKELFILFQVKKVLLVLPSIMNSKNS